VLERFGESDEILFTKEGSVTESALPQLASPAQRRGPVDGKVSRLVLMLYFDLSRLTFLFVFPITGFPADSERSVELELSGGLS